MPWGQGRGWRGRGRGWGAWGQWQGGGPWPGRGPFAYLPPWERPGWLLGPGACWRLLGVPGWLAQARGLLPGSPQAASPEEAEERLLEEYRRRLEEELRAVEERLREIRGRRGQE